MAFWDDWRKMITYERMLLIIGALLVQSWDVALLDACLKEGFAYSCLIPYRLRTQVALLGHFARLLLIRSKTFR